MGQETDCAHAHCAVLEPPLSHRHRSTTSLCLISFPCSKGNWTDVFRIEHSVNFWLPHRSRCDNSFFWCDYNICIYPFIAVCSCKETGWHVLWTTKLSTLMKLHLLWKELMLEWQSPTANLLFWRFQEACGLLPWKFKNNTNWNLLLIIFSSIKYQLV